MAKQKLLQPPFVNNKSPATGIGGQQTRAPVTSGGPDNAMPRLGVKGLGTEPK